MMKQVKLRAMEPEDLELLYEIENDTDLWPIGATNVPYSRYILHDYIAQASADIYTDKQVRLIIETESYHTIGLIDLVNFNPQHSRAELGIIIKKDYQYQGWGTLALQQLIAYATTTLHLHQIYAIVAETNIACCHLLLKQGFQNHATLQQWLHADKGYQNALLMQLFLEKM